mmetsp:Transcript_26075/g.54606  ORF Transcript_26075/g.54606 Transcript_26075/m.54606 type:complete len:138 (-) Transcript_26075:1477-1890(-)
MRQRIDPQIGVPMDRRDSPIDVAINLLLYTFVWVPTATVVAVGQKFVFLCTSFCCNNADPLVSFAALSPSSFDRRNSSAASLAAVLADEVLAWILADTLVGGTGGAIFRKFMMVKKKCFCNTLVASTTSVQFYWPWL